MADIHVDSLILFLNLAERKLTVLAVLAGKHNGLRECL